MQQLLALFSMLFLVQLMSQPAIAANSVFDEDVIACGEAPTNCGVNPPASDPLTSGSVVVDADESVHVSLRGAAANTTYTIFIGIWERNGFFDAKYFGGGSCSGQDIGTVVTNGQGNYTGPIIDYNGNHFSFPAGTSINQLNFAFNNPPCTRTQFTTGIKLWLEKETTSRHDHRPPRSK